LWLGNAPSAGRPPPAERLRQGVTRGDYLLVAGFRRPQLASECELRQKVDDVIDAKLQPTKADKSLPGTLTNQQGRLVRYEIRLNEVLFDYIRAHKLYNGAIQAAANTVSFPHGSMLIKAAWRELETQDEPLFHTLHRWPVSAGEGHRHEGQCLSEEPRLC
jgi:hypothetical protein